MGTKVADVMTQRPRAVAPQTPLTEVAKVMEAEDVGAVPLVEGDRLVGIKTATSWYAQSPRAKIRAGCLRPRSPRASF